MVRSFIPITISVGTLFLLLSSATAQTYAPSFPRDGAKKVLALALEEAHNTDAFEIWDVVWIKGKSTGMRDHKLDEVSVFVTDGSVKITRPDGTWSIEQERVGSVRLESKGAVYTEEGASDEPSRAIVFQLKDVVPPKAPITAGIPDQFPRAGAVKLFENERIIVWDQTWKIGTRIPLHNHYNLAAGAWLEGGKICSFSDQGGPDPLLPNNGCVSKKPGDVSLALPRDTPHSEQAIEGPPRAIWVQFK